MYNVLARHYDEMQGDVPEKLAAWISGSVPAGSSQSVLELGCGSGSVLAALPNSWKKTGVDISPEMVALACSKLPSASFINDDVLQLDLGLRFDLVICVFDTINHFLSDEDWLNLFEAARRHLKEDGLFLFDMHTTGRIQTISESAPLIADLKDGTILLQEVNAGADGSSVVWTLRFLEPDGDLFRLLSEQITEWSMPLARMKKLAKRAGLATEVPLQRVGVEATDDSARAYITARPVPPSAHITSDLLR